MNLGFFSHNVNVVKNREVLLSHLSQVRPDARPDVYQAGFQFPNVCKLGKDTIPVCVRPSPCILSPDTLIAGGTTIPYGYIFPWKNNKRKLESIDKPDRKQKKINTVQKLKTIENVHQVQSEPIDLSIKKTKVKINQVKINHNKVTCTSHGASRTPISHLRSILCGQNSYNPTTNNKELNSENKPVTLAKKNSYPVTSRVLSWLQDVVHFAKETPEFGMLSNSDKSKLLHLSWTQLLMLYMAENYLIFAVTAIHDQNLVSVETPTMGHVQKIEYFIKKCQNLALSSEEYKYIRLSVLFNISVGSSKKIIKLENPDLIEESHQMYLKKLEQYERRNNKLLFYPRILMLFPSLYSINCGAVTHLFLFNISEQLQEDTYFSSQFSD